MADQIPRLTTQTLQVLAVFASADPQTEWWGLDVAKRAGLKPGVIYPIFKRLLDANWVERRWEDVDPKEVGRPKRRLYRLTGMGAPAARQAVEDHLAAFDATRPISPAPRPRLA